MASDPIGFPCPNKTCGAPPGFPCKDRATGRMQHPPHPARVARANRRPKGSRRVYRPRLLHSQITAIFQAIGEVTAGEMETWTDAEVKALDEASAALSDELHRRIVWPGGKVPDAQP